MTRTITAISGLVMLAMAGGAAPIAAHETQLPQLTDVPVGRTEVVERRRETCWRTNRSTKQRFRVC